MRHLEMAHWNLARRPTGNQPEVWLRSASSAANVPEIHIFAGGQRCSSAGRPGTYLNGENAFIP